LLTLSLFLFSLFWFLGLVLSYPLIIFFGLSILIILPVFTIWVVLIVLIVFIIFDGFNS